MPRSFLVKKTTKCKDERTLSCGAGVKVVSSEDAVVGDTCQQQCNMTPTSTSHQYLTVGADRHNNADSIAHEILKMRPVDTTVAGDQQHQLQMPQAIHLFSGEYTVHVPSWAALSVSWNSLLSAS